jgi:hypothetical protein
LRFNRSSCSASRLVVSMRAAWTPSSIHGRHPRPDSDGETRATTGAPLVPR